MVVLPLTLHCKLGVRWLQTAQTPFSHQASRCSSTGTWVCSANVSFLSLLLKFQKATSEEKHSGEPGQCDSNSCDFLEQSLTLCRQELSGRGSNADFWRLSSESYFGLSCRELEIYKPFYVQGERSQHCLQGVSQARGDEQRLSDSQARSKFPFY
jgi:hypothetical protein